MDHLLWTVPHTMFFLWRQRVFSVMKIIWAITRVYLYSRPVIVFGKVLWLFFACGQCFIFLKESKVSLGKKRPHYLAIKLTLFLFLFYLFIFLRDKKKIDIYTKSPTLIMGKGQWARHGVNQIIQQKIGEIRRIMIHLLYHYSYTMPLIYSHKLIIYPSFSFSFFLFFKESIW